MRKWIVLSLVPVLSMSCGYRGSDEAGVYNDDAALSFVPSTFEALKKNVLEPNCISCHAAFGTEPGIFLYLEPGKPDESQLYQRTASGSMPPSGRLSGAKIELMRRYILAVSDSHQAQREGEPAPQASPTPVPGPAPTFARVYDQILKPMCLRCHGENGFHELKFVDEASTRASIDRILIRMEAGTMPPRRAPERKPTPEDIQLLRAWVQSF